MRPLVRVWRMGLIGYNECASTQTRLADELKRGEGSNTLLLLQHPPVYTVGIRTENYPLAEESRLRELGADFVRTDRGGLITFHGPGQLVAYPILDLRQLDIAGSRRYVHLLEEVAILTCNAVGLKHATRHPVNPGVWVERRGNDMNQAPACKICAIGVHCSGGVTKHGLALNCDVNLDWFSHIVACGLPGMGVTSLSHELQREVTVEEAQTQFEKAFQDVFNCELAKREEKLT